MFDLSDEMQGRGASKIGFHIDPPDPEYYMQPCLSTYLTGLSGVYPMGGTLYC